VKVEDFPKVDAIVVADGHQDEVGSSAEIALATGAKIIARCGHPLPFQRARPQDLVEQARLLRTENPNLKTVIPHHWRLQPPPGAHTPEDVATAFKASGLPVTVIKPELRKVYELTK
jgi:L-ascorbate metabolism protein UlaG (beta-lactamase superfamily)